MLNELMHIAREIYPEGNLWGRETARVVWVWEPGKLKGRIAFRFKQGGRIKITRMTTYGTVSKSFVLADPECFNQVRKFAEE